MPAESPAPEPPPAPAARLGTGHRGGAARRLPMFPLSTVLYPHARLPLQVFEPRYRALLRDCLAADRRLGVVLIARGSEVGGGDVRVDVGCEGEIETVKPLPGGRSAILVRGVTRIRVTRWLDDDPYPLAVVSITAEPAAAGGEQLEQAEREVRHVRALLSELGQGPAIAPHVNLGVDPDERGWRMCALAPCNALDRQRLLECPTQEQRLGLLTRLMREMGDDLRRMLAGG